MLAPLTWAACAAIGELWIDVVTFVAGVSAILVETLLYPPWIRLGSSGLTIGSWFRRRRYSWNTLERFELGNPHIPEAAYVVLKRQDGLAQEEVVRLPYVDMSPTEVVRTLQAHYRRESEHLAQ